jgi:hypothetical protein
MARPRGIPDEQLLAAARGLLYEVGPAAFTQLAALALDFQDEQMRELLVAGWREMEGHLIRPGRLPDDPARGRHRRDPGGGCRPSPRPGQAPARREPVRPASPSAFPNGWPRPRRPARLMWQAGKKPAGNAVASLRVRTYPE